MSMETMIMTEQDGDSIKCPFCSKHDWRSRAYLVKTVDSKVSSPPWHDDAGRLHLGDESRIVIDHFRCNRGHKWTIKR